MRHQDRFIRAIGRGLRHDCAVMAPRGKAACSSPPSLLVATSGGADSVALLRALEMLRQRRGWFMKLTVGHVQHGLRPEAEADAAFVSRLAQQLELPYLRVDLKRWSVEENLEAAARSARYEALAVMAQSAQAHYVVTAHHADDQLETMLMRWLRGCSVRGLAGMAWKRRLPLPPGILPDLPPELPPDILPHSDLLSSTDTIPDTSSPHEDSSDRLNLPLDTVVSYDSTDAAGPWLVRPMLAVDRAMVLEFLQALGQPWREDRTNRDRSRTRAYLRHEVIPRLRAVRGDAALRAVSMADHLRQVAEVLEWQVRGAGEQLVTPGVGVTMIRRAEARQVAEVVLAGLLRRCLIKAGVGADHLSRRTLESLCVAVRDDQGGRRSFRLNHGVTVTVTRDEVRIQHGGPGLS